MKKKSQPYWTKSRGRFGGSTKSYNDTFVRAMELILPRRIWYRKFYLYSAHWRSFRKEVGNKYHWRCQNCKRIGNDIHHLTYERIWYERMSDVRLLCRSCHKKQHAVARIYN